MVVQYCPWHKINLLFGSNLDYFGERRIEWLHLYEHVIFLKKLGKKRMDNYLSEHGQNRLTV